MSVFKQLIVLALIAAVGYGGYEVYLQQTAEPIVEAPVSSPRSVTIETASVESRMIAETVEAIGTTRAQQSVAIVPEADGRLIDLAIEPGQHVVQGAVLARLDDTVARADLAEAKARLTEQQQVLARMERLLSTNAVSQASLEEATARLAEAEAQLDRAKQGVVNRTISAPFNGVVGLSEVDIGARLEQGDVITRLDDLSQVVLEFSLPETLYALVQPGLPVEARSVVFPDKTFEGRIAARDSRVDPVARAFRTRAILPNEEGILPAGMFMSLSLIIDNKQVLTVPEEAVVFQAAETYVYRIEDEKAVRLKVKTGPRQDGFVAILSGLSAGDEIATRGLTRLRDGAKVKLKSDTQTAESATQDGDS
ncbi:MAG: efflux RND transporter periplasmic adaptor subunit [Pseudomonadota bacterium]